MNLSRSVITLTISALILWITATPAFSANKVMAPDEIPGTTKVDAEGVLKLAETIPNLIIIDSRIALDRKQGYIQGSISLPDTDTNCDSLARIIPAKDSPVLFYCNGVKCGRSVKASRTALQCGYTRLYWFRGGFEEWKQKNYPYLKE